MQKKKNNWSKPQFKNKIVDDCFIYDKPDYFAKDYRNRKGKNGKDQAYVVEDGNFSTMVTLVNLVSNITD